MSENDYYVFILVLLISIASFLKCVKKKCQLQCYSLSSSRCPQEVYSMHLNMNIEIKQLPAMRMNLVTSYVGITEHALIPPYCVLSTAPVTLIVPLFLMELNHVATQPSIVHLQLNVLFHALVTTAAPI